MKKKLKSPLGNNKIPQDLIKVIKKNKKFIIISHINPEGDAIGCQIALRELLISLGKDVRIVNSDKIPSCYRFISGWKSISRSLKDFSYQVIFILDCSDLSRIGKLKDRVNKNILMVNIDHHESNKIFGNINWIDPKASSVSEMIYRLYKKLSVGINKKGALAIYAGLVSDTGCFRYANTQPETLAIASQLLKYKFPVYDIYRHIFGYISFLDIKLAVEALSELKYNKTKSIVWLMLKRKLLKRKAAEFDIGYLLLSLMRLIKGVEVAILFKEIPDRTDAVRVNFRSNGRINVSRLASLFGGGGHRTASGCTVKGNAEQAEKKVLRELSRIV